MPDTNRQNLDPGLSATDCGVQAAGRSVAPGAELLLSDVERAALLAERLSVLSENVPGVLHQFILHPDGRMAFPYVSKGVQRIYGVTVEEAVADANVVLQMLHPSDLDRIVKSIQVSAEELSLWKEEFRVCVPDAPMRWVSGQASPQRLEDGATLWHGYVFDITDQKRQADELQETQTGFRLALEAAKIGFWRWNLLTNALQWSDEIYSMFGYASGTLDLDFNRFRALMHPEDAPEALAQIDKAQQLEGRIRAQFRLRNSQDEWVWVECRGRAVQYYDQKRPTLIMGTYTNINSMVQARQALEQAKAQAEQANQEKSVFMASMSHEVRTSLAGIVGLTQLGLEETDPIIVQDRLRKVNQSARLLLELLNDVLDFSKMEARRLTLELRRFVLPDITTPVINLFQPLAQQKGLDIHVNLHGLDSNVYEGDALRLRQVLQNLLGNALKFTEHGAVSLDVVHEKTADQTDWLCFTVRDTGIGIAEDQRGRLFKAFSQADNSIGRKYGGTGLGLIISQRLVHAMGGAGIKLESQAGLGAMFSFVLPFTRSTLGPENAGVAQQEAVSDPHRILRPVDQPVASQDSQALPANILNVDDALSRLMGDKALLRKLLGQFYQQIEGPYAQLVAKLARLDETSTAGDFALAQSLAHS